MKKFGIIAAVIFMSIALIVPAMAIEVDATGSFRVRGFMKSNGSATLAEETGSSSYYDFRLRPEITVKVNDDVKINARVSIFSENLGGTGVDTSDPADATYDSSSKSTTAQWERAWMTIDTDYGQFDLGRMKGSCFGLSLFDTDATRDRFKWTYKTKDQVKKNIKDTGQDANFFAVVEKNAEIDGTTDTSSDSDSDAYYFGGIYKLANHLTAGGLVAYSRTATESVTDGSTTTASALTADQVLILFADSKIDDTFGVKGELYYRTGEKEGDANVTANSEYTTDRSGMGFYLAGTGNFGSSLEEIGMNNAKKYFKQTNQIKAEIGLVYASGDSDLNDDSSESLAGVGSGGGLNAGLGDEWTPFVILQDANALLGSAFNSDVASNGVMLFYAQADYALSDDMKVTGLIGMATADQVDATQDDSYGTEIDAKLEWKLTDALTYNFNLGYLMAGDYFEFGGAQETEDTFTLYHKLQLDF
jgi:hypothetical protein